MGPVTTPRGLSKAEEQAADALAHGAKLQLGTGKAYKNATTNEGAGAGKGVSGYFMDPTILTDMNDQMLIAKEETFAPVTGLFGSRGGNRSKTPTNMLFGEYWNSEVAHAVAEWSGGEQQGGAFHSEQETTPFGYAVLPGSHEPDRQRQNGEIHGGRVSVAGFERCLFPEPGGVKEH